MDDRNDVKMVDELHQLQTEIQAEISKVIVGQKVVVKQLLLAQLCQGHCLLIGVPGLAKTLMIKTLAEVLDLQFRRIQFTPDLMPSDITGTEIIEEDRSTGKRSFRFVQGPVFGNIILADEINRTPPKTQAALLEAMQEHRVTAAGTSHQLEEPFFVLATQNPIEQEGTYPLPEAQLDRFMFSLKVEYPSESEEIEIVKSTTSAALATLRKIAGRKDILRFQDLVRRVPVADHVVEYAVKIVAATRPENPAAPEFIRKWVEWGAGPRASQYLILGAKTNAILAGRPTPEKKDILEILKPVLRHRIILNFNAEADGMDTDTVTDKIVATIG